MSLGYQRLNVDPCAYIKRFEEDYFVLLLYVDGMLVVGPNEDLIKGLKAQLAKEFEPENLRPTNMILGMQIDRDRNNSLIWIS